MDASLKTLRFSVIIIYIHSLPSTRLSFEIDLHKAKIGISNVSNFKCRPVKRQIGGNTKFELWENTVENRVQSWHWRSKGDSSPARWLQRGGGVIRNKKSYYYYYLVFIWLPIVTKKYDLSFLLLTKKFNLRLFCWALNLYFYMYLLQSHVWLPCRRKTISQDLPVQPKLHPQVSSPTLLNYVMLYCKISVAKCKIWHQHYTKCCP